MCPIHVNNRNEDPKVPSTSPTDNDAVARQRMMNVHSNKHVHRYSTGGPTGEISASSSTLSLTPLLSCSFVWSVITGPTPDRSEFGWIWLGNVTQSLRPIAIHGCHVDLQANTSSSRFPLSVSAKR